jgi:4-hydroxyacetophenone monooxygenase
MRIASQSWEPITEDDAAIEAALAEAHVPSLIAALVHLTGDPSILRGEARPSAEFFGDPQAGITEAQQAEVRAKALEVLKAYRDGGGKLPPPPSADDVHEMVNFLIGQPISRDYVEFLETELSLDGTDPYGGHYLEAIPQAVKSSFNVLIIGAGMSGILAAIRLAEAGIPHLIIEKNADVGGTWFENTYPGCRVDSPNHTYSYSFRPNDWPQHFSDQKVLLDYFDRCATDFGIRDNVRFRTEVKTAVFDESAGHWKVTVVNEDGRPEELDANAIVSATGQLNRPRFPDIEGQDRFEGIAFHSAEWQHEHDLTGKRIAVIGTGASAFQFVPEIAEDAEEVIIFQRTPAWMSPTPEYHDYIPDGKHWLLNHVPFYAKWYRFWMFWMTAEGLLTSVTRDPAWNDAEHAISAQNDELRETLTTYISELVGDDPDLLAKTIPDYPPGGKRMLRDNGNYIRALKRDNVQVLTDPIAEITATGLTGDSGTAYDVDVIIYGTGFKANRFLWPMEVTGVGGKDLQNHWDGDPRAYLGVTVPDFPNLFCLYGPNTNIVVNGSIIFFSECEVRYIMGCLKLLLAQGHAAMNCRQDVHDAYNSWVDDGNNQMAWAVDNVTSWYKNSAGRVTQNWPYTLLEFWTRTKEPNAADYTFI